MSEHTPGPWKAGSDLTGSVPQVWSDSGRHVNRVVATLNNDLQAKANARLIAAAPDLLQALLDLASVTSPELPEWHAAVEVIEKAQGMEV